MGFFPSAVAASSQAVQGYSPVTFGADKTGVTDSTAAFQAAINAAIGSAAFGAALVSIPAGTYNLNTGGMTITGPFKMQGLGAALAAGGSLTPGVTLNCSGAAGGAPGASHLFTFPYQGYLWSGLEIQGIAINYSGTGNVFNQINIAASVFRDMSTTLTAAGSQAIFTSGTNSFLDILHERCVFTTTAAIRTASMINVSTSQSGAISNNLWLRCKFVNQGLDNTQYMIQYSCTGAAPAYHFADNFTDCWFEQPFGGAIKSLSGQGIEIRNCSIWDIFTGQAVGNSTLYFGAAAGGGSQGVRVINCTRNQSGPNGTTTWDVYCEATTSQVQVENFTVKAATSSTVTDAFFNFNACNDVSVLNNVSPQGSTVNGNSSTLITNPSPTQFGVTQGLITPQPAGVLPADLGWLEWNYDGALLVGSAATALPSAAGTPFLIRVNIRQARKITSLIYYLGTLGTLLTAGENFAGLYAGQAGGGFTAGQLIGTTADQTATWDTGGTIGETPQPLAGGPFTVPAGFVWVALMWNGTGVAPSFGKAQNFSATTSNAGTGVAACRWGISSSAGNTSLPASIVPGGNSLSGMSVFAAVS